jgi:hypothetical protein
MLSQSASHAETEVHVVRSVTVVHAAMTAEATEVHAAMTEAQEVHVVSVRLTHLQQSRTTSQRCSKTSLNK